MAQSVNWLRRLSGGASGLVLAVAATGASAAGMLADPAAVVSTAAAGQGVSFEVFFPLRNSAGLEALLKQQQDRTSASYHKWLSPAQFAQQFGPTPVSMNAARAALAASGFSVDAVHSSSLTVSGSVGTVNRAFGASLKTLTHRTGTTQLVSATRLTLPAALQAQGATVVAFANRPNLHIDARKVAVSVPANRVSDHGPYWFTDLRQAYAYPALNAKMSNGAYLDGTGVNVAIVISSQVLNSDVAAAFNHEKFSAISGRPAPTITEVPVDGGTGAADPNSDGFFEASLDTQQVTGGAPGAKVTVLDIPDLSDQHIIDAYLMAVEQNTYSVVSSSFGGCELYYTAAYNGGVDNTGVLRTYDAIFKQGNAEGITFVASSGDSGGLSCPNLSDTAAVAGVEFPSSDPAVTAVGGGNLQTTAPSSTTPLSSAYVTENAYGDPENQNNPFGPSVTNAYWGAGGGPSAVFSTPSYQTLVTTNSTTRTTPDIGMQVGGCPGTEAVLPCGPERSAVYIYVNGTIGGVIGTSVSAPEFAGALALYVQRKGRQGNVNTFLYQQSAAQTSNSANAVYHQHIPGFDGKFSNTFPAGGYDYLYGNGSPLVRNLFSFTDLPAAGTPQTATNP